MADDYEVERRGSAVRVTGPEPSIAEQLDWARRAAARDREFWQGQVMKHRAGAAYAAQRCMPGTAVVATLERLQREHLDRVARGDVREAGT